jgi:hypothetical protein
MSAASAHGQRAAPARVVVIGAIGGMIAGMMMAMVEMIYGWLSDAHTFWDAPMAIWAWVAGIDNFGSPGDHIGSIALGMAGHIVNSMMVGVVFAALMVYVVKVRDIVTPVVIGMVYGLAIWIVMRYLILPLNDGEDALFTTDMVSPQWVWWLSHAVLGMTAGIYYDIVNRTIGAARPHAVSRTH